MRRTWPEPAIQPPGSDYCQWYAAAYIAGLFGISFDWRAIRKWRDEHNRAAAAFLPEALDIAPSWRWWSDHGWVDMFISHSHMPGFRKWVEAYFDYGCIAFAVVHISPDCGHAVVLLEYNDEGVLMADSVRGLIREPWELFCSPNRNGQPTRIEAWFKLPKEA